MDNNEIKTIKKSRDRQVNKLTKLLKLLVSTEWKMITVANETNDNTSFKAAKTISEASKSIQLAISQLISTDFSDMEKLKSVKQNAEKISSLKKIVLGKK